MHKAEVASLLAAWPVGSVLRTQVLRSGIDRANLRVWTTTGKFILTFYRDAKQLRSLQAISRHLGLHRFPYPQYLPTRSGAMWVKTPHGLAALTIHLPGSHPRKPIPLRTLHNLGAVLGRMDVLLASCPSPPTFRPIDWRCIDRRLERMRRRDPMLHARLLGVRQQIGRALRPLLPKCRRSLIHNDYAEVNVLVRGSKVTAVLDLGDMEHGYLPADPAIAVTHQCCLRGRAIPKAAAAFLGGYLAQSPLTAAERRAVYWLILKRGIDLTTYFWEQRYATTKDHLGPKRMNAEMVRWGMRSIESWSAVGQGRFVQLCGPSYQLSEPSD